MTSAPVLHYFEVMGEGQCSLKWQVVSYLIEWASVLAKFKTKRTNKGNNRKYDTTQPMKYSVQQEVGPYPKW